MKPMHGMSGVEFENSDGVSDAYFSGMEKSIFHDGPKWKYDRRRDHHG